MGKNLVSLFRIYKKLKINFCMLKPCKHKRTAYALRCSHAALGVEQECKEIIFHERDANIPRTLFLCTLAAFQFHFLLFHFLFIIVNIIKNFVKYLFWGPTKWAVLYIVQLEQAALPLSSSYWKTPAATCGSQTCKNLSTQRACFPLCSS